MFKGIFCAIFGACVFFQFISPAAACDVQLGRPNSCNQYCDGDFINGPEIISCGEYVRQKRAKAAQIAKDREDRIARDQAARRQALEEQRLKDERIREAENARIRQQEATDKQKRDNAAAAEDAADRKRQNDIDLASRELELKKQQFEQTERERAAKTKAGTGAPTVETGLSIALIGAMLLIGFLVKPGNPIVKFGTMIVIPAVSFAVKYYFGYDLKAEVTLAEWPLFAPAFGGVVVAALMYKYG